MPVLLLFPYTSDNYGGSRFVFSSDLPDRNISIAGIEYTEKLIHSNNYCATRINGSHGNAGLAVYGRYTIVYEPG